MIEFFLDNDTKVIHDPHCPFAKFVMPHVNLLQALRAVELGYKTCHTCANASEFLPDELEAG